MNQKREFLLILSEDVYRRDPILEPGLGPFLDTNNLSFKFLNIQSRLTENFIS